MPSGAPEAIFLYLIWMIASNDVGSVWCREGNGCWQDQPFWPEVELGVGGERGGEGGFLHILTHLCTRFWNINFRLRVLDMHYVALNEVWINLQHTSGKYIIENYPDYFAIFNYQFLPPQPSALFDQLEHNIWYFGHFVSMSFGSDINYLKFCNPCHHPTPHKKSSTMWPSNVQTRVVLSTVGCCLKIPHLDLPLEGGLQSALVARFSQFAVAACPTSGFDSCPDVFCILCFVFCNLYCVFCILLMQPVPWLWQLPCLTQLWWFCATMQQRRWSNSLNQRPS